MPFPKPVTQEQLQGEYPTLLCAESGYKINKKLTVVLKLEVDDSGVMKIAYLFSVTSFGDPVYTGYYIGEALTAYNNITRSYFTPEPSY